MTDKNGKAGLSNTHEIAEVESGASSREQTKTRLNVTVLSRTSNWLKGRGNASNTIDELVEAAIAGNLESADHASKIAELTRDNSELKVKLSQVQEESEKHLDYQVIRDQVLNSLKLGKQAPGYKSAIKALNRFIAEIQ